MDRSPVHLRALVSGGGWRPIEKLPQSVGKHGDLKRSERIVCLVGGRSGARLAAALQRTLAHGNLTVIASTADDFEHWGLRISPHLDELLLNLLPVEQVGEASFAALHAMGQLGGEDWLPLSDQALALHLRRTEWLRAGYSLSEITDRLRRSLGIPSLLLPMSDEPVQSYIHTDEGDLPFQHFIVRRESEPVVIDRTFVGAEAAHTPTAVKTALANADAIFLCADNPFLQLDAMLSVSELRRHLYHTRAPKVLLAPFSPADAEDAPTPTRKMMLELGKMPSPLSIVDHYAGAVDGVVFDHADAHLCDAVDHPVLVASLANQLNQLAGQIAPALLDFAHDIAQPALAA